VVVRDFDVERIAVFPYEANPKLIIYSNAELPFTFGLQSLQTVSGRNAKIVQSSSCIQQKKLSQRYANQARRKLSGFASQPK
jgi:hypothetical protein